MLNIVAYIVYFLVITTVIIWIGLKCYHEGRLFLLDIFDGDHTKADTSNKLLLMGYYLINIGYAALQVKYWPKIGSGEQMIATIALRTGILLMILAVLHYLNIVFVRFVNKSGIKF